MTAFGKQDRLPRASTRARRNSQRWRAGSSIVAADGGLAVNGDGKLAISLVTPSGLILNTTGLAVDPSDTSLTLESAGVKVNLATDPGLEVSSGLRVKANNAKAITREAAGVGVLLDADPGLEFNGSSGLRVKANTAKAITREAAGVGVLLASDPALEFDGSSGVRVKVKASGGVTRDADGLSIPLTPTSATTTYTALSTDRYIRADATAGAFTITLPSAATVGAGWVLTVKKIDTSVNVVTIDGDGAETIDGAASYDLADAYEAVTLVSDGTNWDII